MYIIKMNALQNNFHPYEYQSHRVACWEEGYVGVPEDLVPQVVLSGGYCDLEFQGSQLVGVTPTEKPREPTEPAYTELELAQQAITDLELSDIQQGQAITDLELMLLEGQAHG